jgi:hypothetical protein
MIFIRASCLNCCTISRFPRSKVALAALSGGDRNKHHAIVCGSFHQGVFRKCAPGKLPYRRRAESAPRRSDRRFAAWAVGRNSRGRRELQDGGYQVHATVR